MKRTFTFIAALLLMAQANAAPIGEQKAKEIARQFMMEKAGKNSQQSLDISFAEQSLETAVETDELYVFNSDNSFVVVSGDDRTVPVLGWSDEGKYDAQKANPAVEQWLDYYKHEIQSLDGDVTPVKELTSWGNIEPIVPYHWNQPAPYNKLVPKDAKDGKPSMAGCPSISLAQVLATLKYPSAQMQRGIPAQDVYEYDDDDKLVFKQHLDALPATSFNWDILKTKYEATETGESVDEVAKLIQYCGYALGTTYTSSLSGAQSLSTYNATYLFFGYDSKIAY
ncbi:MAG: C10 family peptidase, partial [Prevotella sp.]|nr:C10 family peptidase [Prevotella sp.]